MTVSVPLCVFSIHVWFYCIGSEFVLHFLQHCCIKTIANQALSRCHCIFTDTHSLLYLFPTLLRTYEQQVWWIHHTIRPVSLIFSPVLMQCKIVKKQPVSGELLLKTTLKKEECYQAEFGSEAATSDDKIQITQRFSLFFSSWQFNSYHNLYFPLRVCVCVCLCETDPLGSHTLR